MGTLYENIKALCDERGITPAEFNRQVGLPRNFMSELKSGRKSTIQATTAQKIAVFFDVPIGRVINGAVKTYNTEEVKALKAKQYMNPEQQALWDIISKLSREEGVRLLKVVDAVIDK